MKFGDNDRVRAIIDLACAKLPHSKMNASDINDVERVIRSKLQETLPTIQRSPYRGYPDRSPRNLPNLTGSLNGSMSCRANQRSHPRTGQGSTASLRGPSIE